MVRGTAGKSNVKMASRFAYAAGSQAFWPISASSLCMSSLGCRPEDPRVRPRLAWPASWWARRTILWDLATGFMNGVALWVAQFGVFAGAGTLTGYVIVGLGLLLPWMSWPQLIVFGVGLLIGLPAWLGSHDYSRKQQAVERHSLVMTFRWRSSC
jgi:hypothetical protein